MPIHEVVEALEQLKAHYRNFANLAEQKKQALIKNQVDRLTAIVQQESRLIKQTSVAEQEWMRAASAFLRENGAHPETAVTMTAIAEMAGEQAQKDKLLRMRDELLADIKQLQDYNETNRQLIEQSLAFVNYSLELLTDSPENEAFYRHPSQQAKTQSGIFDRKA
ncbi:MAG TPA: flagellar protein FlgN [Bacilli bacterium]